MVPEAAAGGWESGRGLAWSASRHGKQFKSTRPAWGAHAGTRPSKGLASSCRVQACKCPHPLACWHICINVDTVTLRVTEHMVVPEACEAAANRRPCGVLITLCGCASSGQELTHVCREGWRRQSKVKLHSSKSIQASLPNSSDVLDGRWLRQAARHHGRVAGVWLVYRSTGVAKCR